MNPLRYCALLLPILLVSCSMPVDNVRRVDEAKNESVITTGTPEEKSDRVRRRFDQAMLFVAEGEFDKAEAIFEQLIASGIRREAIFINAGLIQARNNDNERAIRYFDEALTLNPASVIALNEKAIIQRKTGRFSEAKASYQKAIEVDKEYLPAIKNLGVLCDVYLQDYECARQAYQRYIDLDQDDEQVKLWLSMMENKL